MRIHVILQIKSINCIVKRKINILPKQKQINWGFSLKRLVIKMQSFVKLLERVRVTNRLHRWWIKWNLEVIKVTLIVGKIIVKRENIIIDIKILTIIVDKIANLDIKLPIPLIKRIPITSLTFR